MITLQDFSLPRLPKGTHVEAANDVLAEAKANAKISNMFPRVLSQFETAVEKENKVYVVSMRSPLTPVIAVDNNARDTFYLTFMRAIKRLMRSQNPELQPVAERLWLRTKLYGVKVNGQYDRETGAMMKLCEWLMGEAKDDVAKVGLTSVVEAMNEANNRVCQTLLERDQEMGDVQRGALKAARQDTDHWFRSLVMAINGDIVVNGESGYTPFVKWYNEYTDRLRKWVLKNRKRIKDELVEDDEFEEEEFEEETEEETEGEETDIPTPPTEDKPEDSENQKPDEEEKPNEGGNNSGNTGTGSGTGDENTGGTPPEDDDPNMPPPGSGGSGFE